MYNFRFAPNAAPAQVAATLGTFKVAGNLNTNVDGPGGSTGPVSGAFCFGDVSNNSTAGSRTATTQPTSAWSHASRRSTWAH